MREMDPDSLAAVWGRVTVSGNGDMDAETARAILKWKLRRRDVARINELSAMAQAGTLSGDERAELENYLTIGHVLAILHSKARVALKREAAPEPRRVRRKAS
jgi:hypothetical protein